MKLIILAFTLLTQLAFAADPGANESNLYGKWNKIVSNEDFRLDVTMEFKQGKVTATNICQWGGMLGPKLTATVSAKARFTETEIEILESNEDVARSGGLKCNIKIEKDKVNYIVNGDVLKIIDGENTVEFDRVKQ